MDKFRVRDHDVFYLSYDEPNAEKNYADICNKIPWVKRVHGVKGSDAAHKACAERAETERFTTVDGDNIINPKWLDVEIEFDMDTVDLTTSVVSWCGYNIVNGLVYGNGGLKCWPTEYTKTINTHEAATDGEGMEFCWKLDYIQLNDTFSEVHQTASPFQAFRAGFREGVKMSLNQGEHIKPEDFMKTIWGPNLRILSTWMTVGADVENGKYAMLGARMGCYSTTVDTNEWIQVRDLDKMLDYYENSVVHEKIDEDLRLYGESIRQRIDLPVAELDEYQSKFIKYIYPPHKNTGVQDREYK